ncbi:type II secretion system protein [Variovorax paradoxus]|nr:type II secretion system protein [Variovorax paradoxus]
MLLVVFLLSLGLGKAVEVYANSVQRQREEELVHVGSLYREAIQDYYLSAPNGQHRYPDRLEDLLKDSRHLVTRRYLRRLYPDPMTAGAFTPIFAPQGGVWGVTSTSMAQPIRAHIPRGVTQTASDDIRYRDWRFVYEGK